MNCDRDCFRHNNVLLLVLILILIIILIVILFLPLVLLLHRGPDADADADADPFHVSIQVSLFCCCLALIEEGSAIAPTVTYWSIRLKSIKFSLLDYYFCLIPPVFDSGGFRVHLLLSIYSYQHIFYIRTTITMTADDDSCSSYDFVSATDLTVGPTNSDTDTSSCDPNDAFSQQLRIGRAVLWCLLLIYIIQSSVHPTIVPTSP